MYEVTLVLENECNSAYNPVFFFGSKDEALKLVETFVFQGYKALIKEDYDNE